MDQVWDRLQTYRVVPVVAAARADGAVRLAEALSAGGLPCAEITLRTPEAVDVISQMAEIDRFLVGVGTVHRVEQAEAAVEAGARFVVTPGFSEPVARWCLDRTVPVIPGIATPTDLERAFEMGLDRVKFFPAEPLGGVRMLRALSGPYGAVRFLPTGGITERNLADYLRLPSVFACGGSWMVRREWLESGALDEVTRSATAAMAIVRSVSGGG